MQEAFAVWRIWLVPLSCCWLALTGDFNVVLAACRQAMFARGLVLTSDHPFLVDHVIRFLGRLGRVRDRT